MASRMALMTTGSRPSEKFGTHSTNGMAAGSARSCCRCVVRCNAAALGVQDSGVREARLLDGCPIALQEGSAHLGCLKGKCVNDCLSVGLWHVLFSVGGGVMDVDQRTAARDRLVQLLERST